MQIVFRTAWRTAGLLYLFRLFDQGVLFSSDAVLTSTANAEQNQEREKEVGVCSVRFADSACYVRLADTAYRKSLFKPVCRIFHFILTLVREDHFSLAVALTTAANE